jgi:hypothetical protein
VLFFRVVWDLIKQLGQTITQGISLTRIAIPIYIAEPRSYLQMVADGWCYGPVYLQKAAETNDPIERMKNVVTFPMWMNRNVRHNMVANLADFPSYRLSVYGLDNNFLNTIYGSYYIPSETYPQFTYQGITDDSSKADLVRSLYTDAGKQVLPIESEIDGIPDSIMSSKSPGFADGETAFYYRGLNESYTQYLDVLVSESFRDGAFVDTNSPLKMEVSARYQHRKNINVEFMLKIRGMITKMSGFFFSSYPQTAYGSPLLLSMDSYQYLMDYVYELDREAFSLLGMSDEEVLNEIGDPITSPLKQRLFIRVKEGSTSEEREVIMNGLRNFINDDLTVVFDTTDLLSTTAVATNVLLLFFDIVALISSILCFFVLWLSFTANIKENSWEFGVLRAIGLSSSQVIRIYVYEALCIIISSLVLGSATGIGAYFGIESFQFQ